MPAKNLTDQLINELINGRHSPNICQALVLLEGDGRIPGATGLESFRSVVSWETWYGSTAGPFPGVGGAAMTWFRMTVLHSDTAMLLFASTQFGDRFYGAAPYAAAALTERNVDAFDLFIHSPR